MRDLRHSVATVGARAQARALDDDESSRSRRVPVSAWLAVVAVLVLTVACEFWIAADLEAVDEARFVTLTDHAQREWNDRVQRYRFGLEATRAAFVASETVSRAEFARLTSSWHMDSAFPGALGVGFVERVAPGDRERFEAETRADGAPEFRIDDASDAGPQEPRELAIVKFERSEAGRIASIGTDYASMPVAVEALRRSARTGEPASTEILDLGDPPHHEPGFLTFLPVYRNGATTVTEVEREDALAGWVMMPVAVSTVPSAIETVTKGELTCMFDAGTTAPNDAATAAADLVLVSTFSCAGRAWNVRMSTTPRFERAARGILFGVALIGLVVAVLVGLLARARIGAARRARAMADAMTVELRELASVAASRADELSAMADLARVGAWSYDVETGDLKWSRQVKAIHEVAEDWKPTLESAIAFYPGAAGRTIQAVVERAVTHRESFDLELPFVTARDRPIWVRAIGRPVIEGDRVVRVAGAFQDVTEQRSARTALQEAKDAAETATRSKSEFLAMMSHEIRTPLNGVIGVASLLLETKLDEAQLDLVRTVHESGAALLVILNDVLDFSKIEAGRLELEHVPFDLHRVVDDVRRLFAGRAEQKHVGLKTTIRAGVPERVLGDPGRVRQILLNLVGNAVKFTTSGSVDVELSVFEPGARRCGVRIDVVDTGPGMTAETMQRLFQPFTQASAATTRAFGGTGLGLAIAKRLVESMRGTITCSSTVGRGSTFRIDLTLDVAEATRVETSAATTDAAAQARPSLGLRVLLAEDNPVNQRVARRMLERMGCSIEVAENGVEAVDLFQRGEFDIVLMDWHMPVMDGIEATRRIRALPRDRHVPIVALTANAMHGDIQTCRDAGMDEFVAKPVTMERLYEVLTAWADSAARRE